MPSKTELRAEMRILLRDVRETRAERSAKLCASLANRLEFQRAKTVAIFDPLLSEPDVNQLWNIAPRQFFYPRIEEGQLQFYRVDDLAELQPSPTGLPFREPNSADDRRLVLSELDLILVPGLAFSFDGRRLGRGGGYYDRLLAILPPRTTRLGVGFSFQVVFSLPTERHDERVTAVVTD